MNGGHPQHPKTWIYLNNETPVDYDDKDIANELVEM